MTNLEGMTNRFEKAEEKPRSRAEDNELLLKTGKNSEKNIYRKILQCIYIDNDFPVYIDEISAHIGLSNERTSEFVQRLVKKGKIAVEKTKGEDWYVGNNLITWAGCVYHDIFG